MDHPAVTATDHLIVFVVHGYDNDLCANIRCAQGGWTHWSLIGGEWSGDPVAYIRGYLCAVDVWAFNAIRRLAHVDLPLT